MTAHEFKVPVTACSVCGHLLDRAAGPAEPTQLDIVMCAYCGALYQFAADLSMVLVDQAVRDQLIAASPELRQALAVRARVMADLTPERLAELEAQEMPAAPVDREA